MSALQSLAARRFGVVAVSAASLIVCCALAWWQWERYSSAGGSMQNLGYVLQWPLFGLFPAFVFLRMRKLRQTSAQSGADDVTQATQAGPSTKTTAPGDTTSANTSANTSTDTGTTAVDTTDTTDTTDTAGTGAPRPQSRWLYRAPQRPVAADTNSEPDDALAEYNRYLAELHQRDQAQRDRTT